MSVSHLLNNGDLNAYGSYHFAVPANTDETVIAVASTAVPLIFDTSTPTNPTAGPSNLLVTVPTAHYIRYEGGIPMKMKVSASVAVEAAGGANKYVKLELHKEVNGTGGYAKVAGAEAICRTPGNVSFNLSGVDVAKNDHLKLYIANLDDTTNLVVKGANLSVSAF